MVGRQGAYWEDGWNGGAFVHKSCCCQKLAGTKIVCHDFEIRLITTNCHFTRLEIFNRLSWTQGDAHHINWSNHGYQLGCVSREQWRSECPESCGKSYIHLNLLCCIGPYINKRLGNVQICLLKMVAVFSLCFQTPRLQKNLWRGRRGGREWWRGEKSQILYPEKGNRAMKGVHVRMLVPISYDAKLAVILKSVFSRPRMDPLHQAKRQVTVVLFMAVQSRPTPRGSS